VLSVFNPKKTVNTCRLPLNGRHFYDHNQLNTMKYYTCIVFVEGQKSPVKYHNIRNFENFEAFLKKKWPLAMYYNTYDRITKEYTGRRVLKEPG